MKNILSVNFRLARPEGYPGKGDKYLPIFFRIDLKTCHWARVLKLFLNIMAKRVDISRWVYTQLSEEEELNLGNFRN